MSKLVSVLVGAAAVVASLGAAQFAVGRDLTGSLEKVAAASQSDHVNRSAKADRAISVTSVRGTTAVMQVATSNDTSMAIRAAESAPRRDSLVVGKISRRPVACEAPASVLTEVAKMMESGRCVT